MVWSCTVQFQKTEILGPAFGPFFWRNFRGHVLHRSLSVAPLLAPLFDPKNSPQKLHFFVQTLTFRLPHGDHPTPPGQLHLELPC